MPGTVQPIDHWDRRLITGPQRRGVEGIAETPDPTPRAVLEELLPVPGASRRARNVVTDACLRWDLPNVVGAAAIIISELVSNVVDHAHTVMTIEVAHRDSHLISPSTTAPARRQYPRT
jgi:hypothetical protein